jgi:hypothetical protein
MTHLKTLLAATAILAATVGAHAGSPLGDVIITGVGNVLANALDNKLNEFKRNGPTVVSNICGEKPFFERLFGTCYSDQTRALDDFIVTVQRGSTALRSPETIEHGTDLVKIVNGCTGGAGVDFVKIMGCVRDTYQGQHPEWNRYKS